MENPGLLIGVLLPQNHGAHRVRLRNFGNQDAPTIRISRFGLIGPEGIKTWAKFELQTRWRKFAKTPRIPRFSTSSKMNSAHWAATRTPGLKNATIAPLPANL